MKLIRIAVLMTLIPSSLMAIEPAKPGAAANEASDAHAETNQKKKVAAAAATAAAEFNRLSASHPEWKSLQTPAAALDALAASGEKISRELSLDILTESRAGVLEWLVLKEGRLTGTPALNQLFHAAKPTTIGERARRHARNLISTFNASLAGGSPKAREAGDVAGAVELIRKGVAGGGAFAGTFFQAPMSGEDAIEAMAYITFAGDMLQFNDAVSLPDENKPVPAPPAPDVVALLEMRLKYER